MGLFDIFKTTPKDPFQGFFPDEISQTYFEIAYGLLYSYAVYFEEVCEEDYICEEDNEIAFTLEGVKRYISHELGKSCDERVLSGILKYFGQKDNSYSLDIWWGNNILTEAEKNRVYEMRKIIKDSKKYQNPVSKIYDICYRNEFESEYENVLSLCEAKGNASLLKEGFKKKIFDHQKFPFDTSTQVRKLVTRDFFAGNTIIKQAILEAIEFSSFCAGDESEIRHSFRCIDMAYRALHFEKFGNDRKNYKSLTSDDYYNLAVGYPAFQEMLERNPFEQEDCLNNILTLFKEVEIISFYTAESGAWWIDYEDEYFLDSICNMAWKEYATEESNKEYILAQNEFEKVNRIGDVLFDHYYGKYL